MGKTAEYLAALSREEIEQLQASLQAWREAGTENPMIPIGEDLTGDGIADAWGLSAFGELIIVPGVELGQTVYQATGEGGDLDDVGND